MNKRLASLISLVLMVPVIVSSCGLFYNRQDDPRPNFLIIISDD